MNMGSLRAELAFPPRYGTPASGGGRNSAGFERPLGGFDRGLGGFDADASDGELDEEVMILGTTPVARSMAPPPRPPQRNAWTPPVASAPISAPVRGIAAGTVSMGMPALRSAQVCFRPLSPSPDSQWPVW